MENSERLSFHLKEFENSIQTAWKNLQREEDLCDLTLACEGGLIRAHKVIISSMSPILRSIVNQHTHPNPLIYLKGVNHKDLQNVLDFIYQGEVSIASEELNTFLEVSQDLKIQGMSDVIGNKAVQSIDDVAPLFLEMQELMNDSENLKITSDMYDVIGTKAVQSIDQSINDVVPLFLEKKELMNDSENLKIEFDNNFENEINFENDNEMAKSETQMLVTNEQKSFTCRKCNWTCSFEEKGTFEEHLLSAHQEKWFPCILCDFYATKRGNLKAHKRSVHENIFYPCKECGIKYKKKENYKLHINSVHNQVCYPCEKCDYKSDKKSSLKIHVQSIHEGILYPCDREGCNFKAIEITQLKRHTDKIHDGVRYPCKHCEYKATQKGSLKTHIESIHKGIRHPCDTCGYRATEKGSLRKHILKMH